MQGIQARFLPLPCYPEVKKSKENLPEYLAAFIWGCNSRIVVKWEEPPLWPVVLPSLLGFALACITQIVDGVPMLFDWELGTPFAGLVLASMLLYFAPKQIGGSMELIAGVNVGMLVAFLPQLIFFVWFVPVILFWLFQSAYVWKYNYPAFRIGTWLGLGAVSGLYIGGLFAHYFL